MIKFGPCFQKTLFQSIFVELFLKMYVKEFFNGFFIHLKFINLLVVT
jgi:hypothetical protein